MRRCHLALAAALACGFALPAPADDAPWAFAPLVPVAPPDARRGASAIDVFIDARLDAAGLAPAPPASRRELIRRVTIDLHGLLPSPSEVDEFERDVRPDAFERLVDRLLASPRYGERQARHWMDAVHFAETHGHDEDAIRENAWPYRDYLIQSFNDDNPYARFVREQLAGDVHFPDDPEATIATGFIAAGPWDQSSQMGIQDGTLDKAMARVMDRDDMLTQTMATFVSVSAHCSRCHDHKFDPIPQADYYALQAVFAGVDRVERPIDFDADTHRRRRELEVERARLERGELAAGALDGPNFASELRAWEEAMLDGRGGWQVLDPIAVESASGSEHEELDDHSILFGGTRPERETTEISARIAAGATGLRLEVLTHPSLPQRGPGRADNGNLHLSEIRVLARPDAEGDDDGDREANAVEIALDRPIADHDQDGWTIAHALDRDAKTAWGIYPAVGRAHAAVFRFAEALAADCVLTVILEQLHGGNHLIGRPRLAATRAEIVPSPREPLADEIHRALATPASERSEVQRRDVALAFLRAKNRAALDALPAPSRVYAVATDFPAQGNFHPARGPREVQVLARGDIRQPLEPAVPGALSALAALDARFDDLPPDDEGARRAALADWIVDRRNPLTWRSIANRIWAQHFGRGLVATPNEFGGLGARPSHPLLLDWLAVSLRDGGGSLKSLHRAIVLSAAYRRSSIEPRSELVDPDDVLLARFPLRRLDAETMRDAMLQVSGDIDWRMGGPSARQFHASKGVHLTPNVDYLGFAPERPEMRRRSVYRFIFRTQQDPFFSALDCADPSQLAPKREESVTIAQALALRHDAAVIRASARIAERIERELAPATPAERVAELFRRILLRAPADEELGLAISYAEEQGLANAARWILNTNEFLFIR